MSRLNNKKLNNLLKDELDSLNIPDVKEKARKAPIYVDNSPKQATGKKPNYRKGLTSAVALMCVLVVCTCLGVFLPNELGNKGAQNNISYVTIDINPSVTIKVNNNKVVDITNNNKDGGIVIAGIQSDLKGKSIKDAINEVLTSSANAGYLVYDTVESQQKNNAVKIGVISENGLTNNDEANYIEKNVKDFFKERNLFALVVKDSIIEDKNAEALEMYGVTYSKLKLIESVYLMNNKQLSVDKNNKKELDDFNNFVKANKDTRISELYKQLLKVDSLAFDKIYEAIYKVISRPEEFETYLQQNASKVNTKLDSWIKGELDKVKSTAEGISNLIYQKEQSIYASVKQQFSTNIVEIIAEVDEALKSIFTQDSEEKLTVLNEIGEWLKSFTDFDIDLDLHKFDLLNI